MQIYFLCTGTTITGIKECKVICWVVLPIAQRLNPLLPCIPTTIKSASHNSDVLRTSCFGKPSGMNLIVSCF